MPFTAVLVRFAVLCQFKFAEGDLWGNAAWIPRELNRVAGAGTIGDCSLFDRHFGLPVDWPKVPSEVMVRQKREQKTLWE